MPKTLDVFKGEMMCLTTESYVWKIVKFQQTHTKPIVILY